MDSGARRRLDYVVLPRRLPGLAVLERYFPSPPANLVDAELSAFAAPGDVVLDPWAGIGSTARGALGRQMRSVAVEPSPFAQLAAQALLRPPDPASLDAAFVQLAAARRVDVPLSQHIEELYATRCVGCRRPVVADQFVWPRGGEAPGRKVYRCPSCDASVGGPGERVAPIEANDLAKLGIDPAGSVPAPEVELIAQDPGEVDDELPPAPTGLTGGVEDDYPGVLGEPGGPPPPQHRPPAEPPATARDGPRWASTVEPQRVGEPIPTARRALAHPQLRDRFPVLDGRTELVDELLDLYTPRNLYALGTIAEKIDAEFRDGPMSAFMRLALAACLLPASKLNGYPGRVASLRIANGRVRQPSSRHHREVNVWRLFEASFHDVRMAVAALGRDPRPARFAADLTELRGMSANVLWVRCRPAMLGQYLPSESVDLVVGSPARPPGVDELSFEYLATAWLMGREAASALRLEPLFAPASSPGPDGTDAAVLRHAIAAAAAALRPDGRFSVLLNGDDPDRMITVALSGAAAGLELVEIIHCESLRSGGLVSVHLRKPSAEDRLRRAVAARPLRLGTAGGQLTYPELAAAIVRATSALLTDRGEPAALPRLAAAVLLELASSGLLERVALLRPGAESTADAPVEGADARLVGHGFAMLPALLREELWRDDHPTLLRLGEVDRPVWWLREPEAVRPPLADRVEWATFSILSTSDGIDEASLIERIFQIFPGLAAPDEELVRACVESYAVRDRNGLLRTYDEVQARHADHARTIAGLVEFAHRVGLRAWISKAEQRRELDGEPLAGRLADDERRAYLPLIVRGGPTEALGEVDAIWYQRGRLAFLFEVEWTAMLGEPILRRGRRIPPSDDQVRFLVFPAERTELVRLKLDRSPWLRAELSRQNWHFLKWQHLDALLARDGGRLESLEPMLGLDPLVERGGEQLTIFGE